MILDRVANIFSDPCQWVEVDPQPGPSVDDLVAAFASVPALNATEPTDVTVDGFDGQQIEFTVPDFNEDECIDGSFRHVARCKACWAGSQLLGQRPNAHHRLWILDIDGTRLVIGGSWFPDTSQQDRDDLDTILNSIQIDPRRGRAVQRRRSGRNVRSVLHLIRVRRSSTHRVGVADGTGRRATTRAQQIPRSGVAELSVTRSRSTD